jgi:hypothetical protein
MIFIYFSRNANDSSTLRVCKDFNGEVKMETTITVKFPKPVYQRLQRLDRLLEKK